eukprot:3807984-Pleurochrysis_carterae.AAC.1
MAGCETSSAVGSVSTMARGDQRPRVRGGRRRGGACCRGGHRRDGAGVGVRPLRRGVRRAWGNAARRHRIGLRRRPMSRCGKARRASFEEGRHGRAKERPTLGNRRWRGCRQPRRMRRPWRHPP